MEFDEEPMVAARFLHYKPLQMAPFSSGTKDSWIRSFNLVYMRKQQSICVSKTRHCAFVSQMEGLQHAVNCTVTSTADEPWG